MIRTARAWSPRQTRRIAVNTQKALCIPEISIFQCRLHPVGYMHPHRHVATSSNSKAEDKPRTTAEVESQTEVKEESKLEKLEPETKPQQSPASESTRPKTPLPPGTSAMWLEPIVAPFRAYGRVHKRRPYVTQFVSALVIYFVGDLVAQEIGSSAQKGTGNQRETENEKEDEEQSGKVLSWVQNRDWQRTGRALLIGGIAAIPGYKWFVFLSNSFNYSSKLLSLAVKVTVNQLIFTPFFNTYFFGMQSLLSFPTPSPAELLNHIQHTVPTSWWNSCKFWPPITALSFAFIPLHYRSVFGGVVAIGWQTYLSLLDQSVKGQERGKEAGCIKDRGFEEEGRSGCAA